MINYLPKRTRIVPMFLDFIKCVDSRCIFKCDFNSIASFFIILPVTASVSP